MPFVWDPLSHRELATRPYIFDRFPVWQRLQTIPTEIDKLQARVAELEEKLGNKWPGDVCRRCGARAAYLANTRGPNAQGIITELWHCNQCEQDDNRSVKVR